MIFPAADPVACARDAGSRPHEAARARREARMNGACTVGPPRAAVPGSMRIATHPEHPARSRDVAGVRAHAESRPGRPRTVPVHPAARHADVRLDFLVAATRGPTLPRTTRP